MSRKHAPAMVQRLSPRVGEGHALDVTIVGESGSSVTTSFDLSQLPVPDRRFAADSAAVLIEDVGVKLLFGQRQPIGGGLLSLVVISMAFEAVHQFLGSIDDDFFSTYRNIERKVPPIELSTFQQKAEQTVVLNSSIVMAGYTGSLGCMDFYFASPFSVRQVAIVKKLSLEPIVRVNLPAALLFAILNRLRECANQPSFPFSKAVET